MGSRSQLGDLSYNDLSDILQIGLESSRSLRGSGVTGHQSVTGRVICTGAHTGRRSPCVGHCHLHRALLRRRRKRRSRVEERACENGRTLCL